MSGQLVPQRLKKGGDAVPLVIFSYASPVRFLIPVHVSTNPPLTSCIFLSFFLSSCSFGFIFSLLISPLPPNLQAPESSFPETGIPEVQEGIKPASLVVQAIIYG